MSYVINILIDYGIIGIMIAAFFEPILMPVPMEFVSIPIALLNQDKALLYAIILILFSGTGATVGYYIGKFLSDTLLNKFVSAENVSKLKKLYDRNSFLTILTSAFTPIPYEAYVLSAGIFNIGFTKFIIAATISRCIRHLPQAIIIFLYGDVFLGNLKNYTMIIGVIIFIMILLLKYLFRKNSSMNSIIDDNNK